MPLEPQAKRAGRRQKQRSCEPSSVDVLDVRSSRDGGTLRLEWESSEWWRVTLDLPGLTAAARVDSSAYDGERTLGRLFRRMADDWRGWDGEREWASIEGLFELTATHDGLGHVSLRVRLRSGLYDEGWNVGGVIGLDAGGLSNLAREAAAFEASTPK
jgi:Family of unknown function (DUF6228)